MRIAPGLFALLGVCEADRKLAVVGVSAGGEAVRGPLLSAHVREAPAGRLILTLFSAELDVADHIAWSVGGEVLADGPLGEAASFQQADAAELLALCPGPAERADLARKLVEFVLVYMKRAKDPATLAFASSLIDALSPSGLEAEAALVDLAPKSTILAVQDCDKIGRVEAVQVFGEDGFLRPTGQPLLLPGSGVGWWSFDQSPEALHRARIVLWTRDGAFELPPGSVARGGLGRLKNLLNSSPEHVNTGIQWLRNVAGLLVRENSRLPAFLREIDAGAVGEKSPALALPGGASLGITASVRASSGHLTLFGWIDDPNNLIERFSWVGPGGSLIDLNDRMVFLKHHRIPKSEDGGTVRNGVRGFCVSVRTPATAVPLGSEVFRVELASGTSGTMTALPSTTDPRGARDLLLSLPVVRELDEKVFDAGFGDTLASLQKDYLSSPRVEREVEIGTLPVQPRVSVIVPVYKNIAFLNAQYTAFAMERDSAADELIFVIDDPESGPRVEAQLRSLHQLYGLPCRIVFHTQNFGYAPAINTGAAAARAPYLLLLNSDVVPDTPRPVRRLLQALNRGDRRGAVGPKLLFANGTIQHAGLTFDRDAKGHVFNRALFKGYPSAHRPANRRSEPDALTGACLLVDRRAWREVGGISEDYIVGDFEDTDLCLRLRKARWKLAYEPQVSLFHYERQSIDMHQLHRYSSAEQYNRWRHHRIWFGKDASEPTALPRSSTRAAIK